MRRPRIPPGVRVLTKAERRTITRANRRATFPSIKLERYERTLQAIEARLVEARQSAAADSLRHR